jgi:glycerol kinase
MDVLAANVPDAGGVVFVPAFTGLDVPYNNPAARASILGLTLGHDRGHIARAFFESIGYQIRAILETISDDTNLQVKNLLVGGGVSASDQACQIQADLLGIPVLRNTFTETTAWAAGLLAGLGSGIWSGLDELPALPGAHTCFEPSMGEGERDEGFHRWQQAIALVKDWGSGN